jgi:hypothetical protein
MTKAVVRNPGISSDVRGGTTARPEESWIKASRTARIASGMVRVLLISSSVMYFIDVPRLDDDNFSPESLSRKLPAPGEKGAAALTVEIG